VNRPPSILTNMAFRQSRTWREATATICGEGESPDDLGAWTQAVRLLKLRARFDAVVTMGPRPSLAYGVACGVLGLPSKQVMTEVFLDPARPASPAWRLKTALFRWISRRSLGLLANSSAEVGLLARRFGVPESRVRFVPMHTTVESPAPHPDNDGSVVSIGRTLRDPEVLIEAARQIDAPVVVVAGRDDPMPDPVPANVQLLRDIPIGRAHELVARAAVAVVPLRPAERSTGQVFFFEAMAMGKPVVATRCIGTMDYIRDGENGLLVEPGDAAGLADAVNRLLRDPALAARLAAAALADCRTEWTPDRHAGRKLEAIDELRRAGSPAAATA
jgi:glycosyltransferase involved in cell wall biosynthesis